MKGDLYYLGGIQVKQSSEMPEGGGEGDQE